MIAHQDIHEGAWPPSHPPQWHWLFAWLHHYEEVNLDTSPERQKEAFEMSGQLSVPITVITKQDDSQEVVVGYNLARLAPAVA